MAAGEALALCFELNLLDVSFGEDGDVENGGTVGSKSKLFLDMQALKAKISSLASNLSMEAGGKGADKKNLTDQRDLFQRILDFVKVCLIFSCLCLNVWFRLFAANNVDLSFLFSMVSALKNLLRFQESVTF